MWKPYERWIAAVAFLLAIILVGCASSSARVLKRATEIPHFSATYTPTPGDEMAKGLADLTARLEAWGVRVGDLSPEDQTFGRANLEQRLIQLKPGMSVNGRFEVLAHESGHLMQPPALNDGAVAQVFAELVGVGIGKFYGSKHCEAVAARYLAQIKWAFSAEKYLRRDIEYAVQAMTGQIPLPTWTTPQ